MASLAFLTLLPLGIMSKKHGWIGVDLDGTLARHDTTTQFPKIGEPIPKMLERVKQMLNEGYRVKIMTARVAYDHWSRIGSHLSERLSDDSIMG